VRRATHPAVERFLTQALAAQVRRLSIHLLEALFVAADSRVMHRLLDLVDIYANGDDTVRLPVKQDDLASMAGTTRPTANRVLKQLEADGVIELGRGTIAIVDLGGLRRRAARS
jgi:CRP/FNR family cyclic AMP-dependent transcriptional regulator